MTTESVFVSTTIPYVNGDPHVGFAWELCLADVLARYHRARGADVFFLTGTDDNSLKNVLAAERAGIPIADFVRRRGECFEALAKTLCISHDDFIHTASDERHAPAVTKLWARCLAAGDIYRRSYCGRYCVGCECFYAPSELVDGRCPDHEEPLEVVEESNRFFRLSRHEAGVRELIESGALRITPAYRDESLAWSLRGLEDFSISRSTERARGWGVAAPGEGDEVVYVWLDALTNYLSALGYASDGEGYRRFWRRADRRIHVVGKNVTRFHCVYWPAILASAGLAPPTDVVVHGFLTVGGRKIGKSLGNAVDPFALVERYGVERLRYYLLAQFALGRDGDFADARLVESCNAALSDQLGNLLSRLLSLVERHCAGRIPAAITDETPLAAPAAAAAACAGNYLDAGVPDRALDAVFQLIRAGNVHVSECEPWKIARELASERDATRRAVLRRQLDACLGETARLLCWVAGLLEPFLPDTAREIARCLGSALPSAYRRDRAPSWEELLCGAQVVPRGVLFPRLPPLLQ